MVGSGSRCGITPQRNGAEDQEFQPGAQAPPACPVMPMCVCLSHKPLLLCAARGTLAVPTFWDGQRRLQGKITKLFRNVGMVAAKCPLSTDSLLDGEQPACRPISAPGVSSLMPRYVSRFFPVGCHQRVALPAERLFPVGNKERNISEWNLPPPLWFYTPCSGNETPMSVPPW